MKQLYIYGDSNTYGFDPTDFFEARYPLEVIWTNRVKEALYDEWILHVDGVNGRTIPDHVREFERVSAWIGKAERIDLFAIMLGSNDYLNMPRPDEAVVAKKMHRALERISGTIAPEKILLIAPPVMRMIGGNGFPGVDTSDGRLSVAYRQAAEQLGCQFLDTVPWNVPLAADGVHLSEDGHKVFAEKMVEYLMRGRFGDE